MQLLALSLLRRSVLDPDEVIRFQPFLEMPRIDDLFFFLSAVFRLEDDTDGLSPPPPQEVSDKEVRDDGLFGLVASSLDTGMSGSSVGGGGEGIGDEANSSKSSPSSLPSSQLVKLVAASEWCDEDSILADSNPVLVRCIMLCSLRDLDWKICLHRSQISSFSACVG